MSKVNEESKRDILRYKLHFPCQGVAAACGSDQTSHQHSFLWIMCVFAVYLDIRLGLSWEIVENNIINSGFRDEPDDEIKEMKRDVTPVGRSTITWDNIKRQH